MSIMGLLNKQGFNEHYSAIKYRSDLHMSCIGIRYLFHWHHPLILYPLEVVKGSGLSQNVSSVVTWTMLRYGTLWSRLSSVAPRREGSPCFYIWNSQNKRCREVFMFTMSLITCRRDLRIPYITIVYAAFYETQWWHSSVVSLKQKGIPWFYIWNSPSEKEQPVSDHLVDGMRFIITCEVFHSLHAGIMWPSG